MSRTDKDRPWWVKTWQDDRYIEHDHRFGECIEETLDYVKWNGGGRWSHARGHYRKCNKRVERHFYCTKKDPYTYSSYWYFTFAGTRYRIAQECWTERCRCDVPRGRRHSKWVDNRDCPTWGRVQCEGHTEVYRDDSIPCICDDWPERPTCNVWTRDRSQRRYMYGGVPTWFVRVVYHRPERARERRLNDMAREYNTYGDIEDDDFINRQGRNQARWEWW